MTNIFLVSQILSAIIWEARKYWSYCTRNRAITNAYETITITLKEALNIESQRRNHGKSSKWYELRAGQISASVMKEAISTKTESPSLSLIEKICYRRKFRNVATDWGIEYEKLAKDCYFIQNSKTHSNFTI